MIESGENTRGQDYRHLPKRFCLVLFPKDMCIQSVVYCCMEQEVSSGKCGDGTNREVYVIRFDDIRFRHLHSLWHLHQEI